MSNYNPNQPRDAIGRWAKFSETIHTNYAAQKDEEYKQFRWARECGAISFNELNDLFSKIQSSRSLDCFKHSSNGEAIIEVNDKPNTTLGVDNVFVFVKGTKNNFYINRVVRFQAETETEMEILKEHLYEGRTCSDTYLSIYQKQGITREYRNENSPNFAEHRTRGSDGETSRGTDPNNRGRAKYRSGYHLHIGEDGEVTEFFPDDENCT